MLTDWAPHEVTLGENRDAFELDVTVDEARQLELVEGNETFIGRRIIAENMQRELPTFIQYLQQSYRHVNASGPGVPIHVLNAIEAEYTRGHRTNNWLTPELQAINALALHGRGFMMVVPDPDNRVLQTRVEYVPTEDVIYPINLRDFQAAPMIAVRYRVPLTTFEEWAREKKWKQNVVDAVKKQEAHDRAVTKQVPVFLVMVRFQGVVHHFWYVSSPGEEILSTAIEPLFVGKMRKDGQPVPASVYPVFPHYYQITENPVLVERKGRARLDMHDQEAATMGWTAFINGNLRASEIYMAVDQAALTENPEIAQTSEIIKPGVVSKQKLIFYSPKAPEAGALVALQALRTENASGAGQVDFAAQNRQDSRKTATELQAAAEQAQRHQTVPLTVFALGYADLIAFRFDIVRFNIGSGANTEFLKDAPEIREVLGRITLRPAGDIDFVQRNEKLSKLTSFYQLYAQTAVGPVFLQKILELAFPDDYAQMGPLLQDQSRAVGAMMLQVLQALPPGALPPDQFQQVQQIVQQAQQVYGTGTNGMDTQPGNTGPAAPVSGGAGPATPSNSPTQP